MSDDGRIWSGPIRSRRQAEKIISWAGWTGVLLGIWIPAAFLLVKRNQASAIVLAICHVFFVLMGLGVVAAAGRARFPGMAVAGVAVMTLYGFLAFLSVRAGMAAQARRGFLQADAWRAERHEDALAFIAAHSLPGAPAARPAWSFERSAALWRLTDERKVLTGWVLCGDLPTAWCEAGAAANPHDAVVAISHTWRSALASRNAETETLGETGVPVALADELSQRVVMLERWTGDVSLWAGSKNA